MFAASILDIFSVENPQYFEIIFCSRDHSRLDSWHILRSDYACFRRKTYEEANLSNKVTKPDLSQQIYKLSHIKKRYHLRCNSEIEQSQGNTLVIFSINKPHFIQVLTGVKSSVYTTQLNQWHTQVRRKITKLFL